MVNPYLKAPHADAARPVSSEAPNAALLIDFDNVTMGMRSDLAKELKNLLDSDIIKGKVTVQRAYADWRRYPQYIVPLSEASIDLIFAPAYGSSKKNATDIRMAIDGMELVFIRPEIGTFILLTGDSDFSSLVLKLKEYAKYVIGIGIQESSSDILVQNCDEYYSYTALTGLNKATEDGASTPDAWESVEAAVSRMASRGDVMRSDRLKQVIMESSPGFDERSLGFKNFSKFLVAAAKKGLLEIERGENGQYHVAPVGGGAARAKGAKGGEPLAREAATNGDEGRGRKRRGPQIRRPPAEKAAKAPDATAKDARRRGANASRAQTATVRESAPRPDPGPALELLARAVRELRGGSERAVRDSDIKRKMLAIDGSFKESAFGFSKFRKFLLHAESKGAVALERGKGGSLGVKLVSGAAGAAAFDAKALGLPTSESSIKSYLAHRYKGVGIKTAERLVDHFGEKVFEVLWSQPDRVRKVLLRARAESVLTAWAGDYKRRAATAARQARTSSDTAGPRRPRGKRPSGPADTGGDPGTRAAAGATQGTGTKRVARATRTAGVTADTVQGTAVEEDPPARSGLLGLLPWARRSRERGGGGS